MDNIYGEYLPTLERVRDELVRRFTAYHDWMLEETGDSGYEHILARIKSDESMREKCRRKGLPENEYSALVELKDAIGIRVVCSFMDDVFKVVSYIRTFDDCEIIKEKDYIRHAKPNGYRSYHIILAMHVNEKDIQGKQPGTYYVELQLRTIAMDTWAALEHRMRYKKDIPNRQLLDSELKRVADELASCDLSMQTIRELIDSN